MAKKDVERDEREEVDTDHAEQRVYELGLHIDPELGAEEVKKVFEGIKGTIEKAGTVVAEGEPKKVPLAYTVSRGEPTGRRDFTSSFFAWIAYETDGEGHASVAEAAREEGRIFRFLDIRTDKESARHSQELHEMLAQEEGKDLPEEEVSEEELDEALKEVGV